jgi:hypothetical protein
MANFRTSALPIALAVATSFAVGAYTAAAILNSTAPWRRRRRRRIYNSGVASRDGSKGRVCVICSGSVAAVKAAELCEALLSLCEVECVDLVLTRAGVFFQVSLCVVFAYVCLMQVHQCICFAKCLVRFALRIMFGYALIELGNFLSRLYRLAAPSCFMRQA